MISPGGSLHNIFSVSADYIFLKSARIKVLQQPGKLSLAFTQKRFGPMQVNKTKYVKQNFVLSTLTKIYWLAHIAIIKLPTRYFSETMLNIFSNFQSAAKS